MVFLGFLTKVILVVLSFVGVFGGSTGKVEIDCVGVGGIDVLRLGASIGCIEETVLGAINSMFGVTLF